MATLVSKKGNIKYALSGDYPFVARVAPGETFMVESAININDGVIHSLGQQLTASDVTLPFVNGATGPIEVAGAQPGDVLSVEVLDMKLEGLGFTALWPGIGIFPAWSVMPKLVLQGKAAYQTRDYLGNSAFSTFVTAL